MKKQTPIVNKPIGIKISKMQKIDPFFWNMIFSNFLNRWSQFRSPDDVVTILTTPTKRTERLQNITLNSTTKPTPNGPAKKWILFKEFFNKWKTGHFWLDSYFTHQFEVFMFFVQKNRKQVVFVQTETWVPSKQNNKRKSFCTPSVPST